MEVFEWRVDRLRNELDDVLGMIWAMEQSGEILGLYTGVLERKKKWMHFQ